MTLGVDGAADISFTGEKIASVSSYCSSTNDNRWTELYLFKTAGGKFVCHQVGETRWYGERAKYKARVCETIEEVVNFFGYGWLAKELYAEAKIDAANHIE